MKIVVLTDLFENFHVRAIQRADRQGSVELQLHVPRAGGLCPGQRNLLAQVGGGNDPLCERHAIVGQEHDLHLGADLGIAVDHLGDLVDQFDDQLGHHVARRGLPGEDEGARRDLQRRIILEPVVQTIV